MRRGAGIGAIKNRSLAQNKYKEKGNELAENQMATLSRQLEQLKQSLELFAAKHGHKIKHDANFRGQFQAMCASIGVDPLAFSKGCWSEMLRLGQIYYHLATRIIEVCMANQPQTGGIIPLKELVVQLNRTKNRYEPEISSDDVKRSIKKLKCLGTGFVLIHLPGGESLVQSVPGEMSMDQMMILGLVESSGGFTTISDVMKKFSWSDDRAKAAFHYLVQEGMAWIDDADACGERVFWFPSFFEAANSSMAITQNPSALAA